MASTNIASRNYTSACFINSSTMTISRPLIKIVPRLRQHSINITPGLAKSAPCSPLPSTGTLTLAASCYHERQRATQPHFIAGPLGGIARVAPIGQRMRVYHDNYISSFLFHLDTLLIKFLHVMTTFRHFSRLSHLDNFFYLDNSC